MKLIDSELKKDSSRMMEKQSHLLKKAQPEFSSKKKKDEEDDDDSIDSEELNIEDDESKIEAAAVAKTSQHVSRYLEDYKFNDETAKLIFKLPLNTKKILMTK